MNRDQLLHDVEEEIARWHATFPAKLVRERIDALKHEYETLGRKIARFEEEYARWESFNLPRELDLGGGVLALAASQGLTKTERNRRGILEVLAHEGPMSNRRIREMLTDAGVVGPTGQDRKSLDARLYYMVKDGEIMRDRDGIYRLAGQADEQASTRNVQSENGNGS